MTNSKLPQDHTNVVSDLMSIPVDLITKNFKLIL